MATLNRRIGWTFPAEFAETEAPASVEENGAALDVSDLTAKEIEEKVENGELDAAEVYAAELAGKQRKGVLEAYKPEDDEGTTAEN
jgi:hypothetical protein